jgi:hypothetical protein
MEKCGKKLCKRRKKDLTGPTLLEISGNATYQELMQLPTNSVLMDCQGYEAQTASALRFHLAASGTSSRLKVFGA